MIDRQLKTLDSQLRPELKAFFEWANATNQYSHSIYYKLLDNFGLTEDELKFQGFKNVDNFYSVKMEGADVTSEYGEETDPYFVDYSLGGREIILSGIQNLFEIAQSFGDSDDNLQVRYMMIAFSENGETQVPSGIYGLKIGSQLTQEEESQYVKAMKVIESTKPTRILLFKLVKKRQ